MPMLVVVVVVVVVVWIANARVNPEWYKQIWFPCDFLIVDTAATISGSTLDTPLLLTLESVRLVVFKGGESKKLSRNKRGVVVVARGCRMDDCCVCINNQHTWFYFRYIGWLTSRWNKRTTKKKKKKQKQTSSSSWWDTTEWKKTKRRTQLLFFVLTERNLDVDTDTSLMI